MSKYRKRCVICYVLIAIFVKKARFWAFNKLYVPNLLILIIYFVISHNIKS